MRTEIGKLHKKLQTTFIYVTHDQTEAMTMGTRIVVMKDGIIQQVDSPTNLYQYPCNIFVAGFIGSPQMNFLNVTVDCSANGTYLKTGNFSIKLPDGKGNRAEIKKGTTARKLSWASDPRICMTILLSFRLFPIATQKLQSTWLK